MLFPRIGCDVLVTQLVGFGSERYDDLADALAILLLPMLELQGHRTSFSLAELNRPSTFEEDRAEERRHSGFYYPDHSDDRVSGGHEDILSMQW